MSSAARYGLLAAVTSALLLACGDASGPADAGAPRLAGNILIGGDSAVLWVP